MDTICAIATAPGGALGIIRISGPDAIQITDSIFRPKRKSMDLLHAKPYTLSFGHIIDEKGIVDEVLISTFKAPHSFTGEDSTEISCHGSRYILHHIISMLISKGCRVAQAGEYTQRAFLNGKMDLSQAEAVADLIASNTAASHRLAMSQMRGGFSQELRQLRDKLLHFTSLIELELDFSDHEELEFADRAELISLSRDIETKLSKLIDSFNVGNAIKNGVPVAIIGETNAGKSAVLNALLGEEKAIVSNIHGTTRDVIEDTFILQGITFRFIDTAGIRQTDDAIETIGIQRTFQKIEQASIILWIVDAQNAQNQVDTLKDTILPYSNDKKLILVINKTDLQPTTVLNGIPDGIEQISISASKRENLEQLQQAIVEAAGLPQPEQEDIIVTNLRHYEALQHALESIHRVENGLQDNISGDFISQDIRECIYFLQDIMGEVTSDDVLGNIFKNFCIGK